MFPNKEDYFYENFFEAFGYGYYSLINKFGNKFYGLRDFYSLIKTFCRRMSEYH